MYKSIGRNARFGDNDTPFKVVNYNLDEDVSERDLFTSTLDSIPILDVTN